MVASTEPCQNSTQKSATVTPRGSTNPLTNAGTRSTVARIHCARNITPLLRSLDGASLSTITVPRRHRSRSRHKASSGDTRVHRSRSNKIGICRGQDIRHHRTGRLSHHVNLLGVDVVLLSRIRNHVRNSVRLAATTTRQRRLARYIPARRRRARKHGNVALGIRALLPGCPAKVALAGRSAGMDGYNERIGLDLVRLVDVPVLQC